MIRIALALGLVGCSGLTNDQFHVARDGALLPVQVRGNADSGTLVVYETGGPFGGGVEERVVDYQHFSDTLEPSIAIAYYDRRGYGNNNGTLRPEDLTLENYLDDLDALLDVLDDRYAPDEVVLMGHSWGGRFTARYLLDRGSDKVDRWISVAGALVAGGDDAYVPYRRDFVCRYSADRIAAGDGDALWPELQDWCAANPTVDPESDARDVLWEHLDAIYQTVGEPPIRGGKLLAALFGSSYNVTDSLLTPNEISLPMHEAFRNQELLSELGGIDVPSLLVSGEVDDIIPTEVAEDAAALVPDVELVEIPGAAHYVTWPDPEPFGEIVLEWLGR